ncbi:hypothetical protein ACVIGB_006615 [Bradyrhizobium sp. USDA 4341]
MPGRRLTPLKLALSPSATAEALGLNYRNVIKPAIERGELGPVRDVHGRLRIDCADITRWLHSHPKVLSLARKSRTHVDA